MNGQTDRWMNGYVGQVNGWRDGSLDVWLDGWLDGCLDGWMDGWMDGCLNGWID